MARFTGCHHGPDLVCRAALLVRQVQKTVTPERADNKVQTMTEILYRKGWSQGRKRRFIAAAVAVVVVAFCAASARLFVFPARGMPARVDAIIMLNGRGDRVGEALKLAHQHRAPYLAVSLGSSSIVPDSDCAPPVPRVRLICFAPDPATTQGEAENVGRLAAKYHWHSIVLVTITPQDTRARLRLGRCFGGKVYVMTGPIHAYSWPYQIAYEWGATVKALTVQRAC